MSTKNITIQENGLAKSFACQKLRTAAVNGGTVDWIPEDDANDYATLTTLTATENGTYAPPSGKAGFSAVTVDVTAPAEYVQGTDSDGNLYEIRVVPGSGGTPTLQKRKLPSGIRVTARPAKTAYTAGEEIDYTGMVVKLYDGQGNVFTDSRYPDGIIPAGELWLPNRYAAISGDSAAVPAGSDDSVWKSAWLPVTSAAPDWATISTAGKDAYYISLYRSYVTANRSLVFGFFANASFAYVSMFPFTAYWGNARYGSTGSGAAYLNNGVYYYNRNGTVDTPYSADFPRFNVGGDQPAAVANGIASFKAFAAAGYPGAPDTQYVTVGWQDASYTKSRLTAMTPISVSPRAEGEFSGGGGTF